MKTPPRLGLEHLLLLAVLSLFAAGALWVSNSATAGSAKQTTAWASLLPKIGLPLFNGLLPR